MTARLQKLKSRTAINLKVGTNEQQNIIINPIIYLRYPLYQCPIPPGFQWGERMGTPDLSWTAQVGAKTYPKGKIFQAADYGLKNDSTRLSTAALQKAIDECHRSGGEQ